MNRNQILFYAVKYEGEWIKINNAIENGKPWKSIEYPGSYLTICDDAYPDKFKELSNPPWIFFYEGDITYLDTDCTAIIGIRKADSFGISMAKELAEKLKNHTVFTGMFQGMQIEEFRKSEKVIMVLGSGLDVPYPYENKSLIECGKEKHLVISEYPLGARPLAHHFPWRDRLIAALSDTVYVIETGKYSSTMLLAEEALQLAKEVYALPHPYDEYYLEGYEALINKGA